LLVKGLGQWDDLYLLCPDVGDHFLEGGDGARVGVAYPNGRAVIPGDVEQLIEGPRLLAEGRRGLAYMEIEDDGEDDATVRKECEKEEGDFSPPLLSLFEGLLILTVNFRLTYAFGVTVCFLLPSINAVRLLHPGFEVILVDLHRFQMFQCPVQLEVFLLLRFDFTGRSARHRFGLKGDVRLKPLFVDGAILGGVIEGSG
jgi:hypothetical protein